MAAFLSQEWLEDQTAAGAEGEAGPGRAAVSAVVQHLVNGGPDGNVAYVTTVDEGRVVAASLGRVDAPDLTFTWSYEDAERLDRGEIELSTAYMQGRLKAEGDMTKLLLLLEASHPTS